MMGLHLVLSGWINGKRKRKGKGIKGSSSQYSYSLSRISYYDDEEEKEWSGPRNFVLPYPIPKDTAPLFVGSCINGLLCLNYERDFENERERGDKCVVWEPSTDMFQVIPDPPSTRLPCDCGFEWCPAVLETSFLYQGYGLSFDAQSQDYKFVSFTGNYYEEIDFDGHPTLHHSSEHVQVYSVKNNSWKELPYPLSEHNEEIDPDVFEKQGTCVNGVCYWFVGYDHLILSFNFATDKFSYFHYPAHKLDHYIPKLMELDGSLCLVYYPRKTKESKEEGPKRNRKRIKVKMEILEEGIISFWVYNSSSSTWSRKDIFDLRVYGFHKPLWFGKKNNMGYSLLLQRGPNKGALLEYDYATREFNTIHQIDPDYTSLKVFPYVETKTKNNANIWHMSSST